MLLCELGCMRPLDVSVLETLWHHPVQHWSQDTPLLHQDPRRRGEGREGARITTKETSWGPILRFDRGLKRHQARTMQPLGSTSANHDLNPLPGCYSFMSLLPVLIPACLYVVRLILPKLVLVLRTSTPTQRINFEIFHTHLKTWGTFCSHSLLALFYEGLPLYFKK